MTARQDTGRHEDRSNSGQSMQHVDPLPSDPHAYAHRLASFTNVLASKLAYFDRATMHLDRYLSTQFNVLEYIQPDENRLSDILAELLRPQGNHGQGRAFLDTFQEAMGLGRFLSEGSVIVEREHPTTYINQYRRTIDIVASTSNEAIAIENKPFAQDQAAQIRDYAAHLQSRYNRVRIVYLTRDGREPSEHSIDTDEAANLRRAGTLVERSYANHVVDWLDQCIAKCESDRYRWFLRDLCDYVAQTFPPPEPEVDDGRDP